jgi:hypothetical protein
MSEFKLQTKEGKVDYLYDAEFKAIDETWVVHIDYYNKRTYTFSHKQTGHSFTDAVTAFVGDGDWWRRDETLYLAPKWLNMAKRRIKKYLKEVREKDAAGINHFYEEDSE